MLDIIAFFIGFVICCLIPILFLISLVFYCMGIGAPFLGISHTALRGAYAGKIP